MKRRISSKLYKLPKGYDRILNIVIIIMSVFGVIMQTSASMSSSDVTVMDLLKTAAKEVVVLVASYFGYIVAANYYDYRSVKKNISNIYLIGLGGLLLALCCREIGGSHAWITIKGIPFSIQPSEFCKIIMILIMAIYLGDVKREDNDWIKVMSKPVIFTFIYCFIVFAFQSDFGSAMILGIIAFACALVPSNKSFRLGQFVMAACLFGFICLMLFLASDTGLKILENIPALTYQVIRFKAANNPFVNRYGTGYYDLVNSLIGFNTGGLTGVGLGKSLRKYGYLSAADTDFILAVIVEELGLLGFIFVLVGYLALIVILFKHALNAKNDRDKTIIVGVALYFITHFIFNVGGITCLIPLTGIPLLLISSGGSSSLSCMLALGIVQGIIAKEEK